MIEEILSEVSNTYEFVYYVMGTLDSDNRQNNYMLTAFKLITEVTESYPETKSFKKLKEIIEKFLYEIWRGDRLWITT